MDERIEVTALRELGECAAIEHEIDLVNGRAERPCPFSTFAFIRNFVEHDEFRDKGSRELLFLVARSAGRVVGYLPLQRVWESLGRYRYPKIEFLITRDNDRPHVVAEPELLTACTQAFYGYLLEREPCWDMLDFTDQDDASSLMVLPPELSSRRYYVRLFETPPTSAIHLRWRSLADYFSALDRKFRSSVARSVRRLFASGAVEYTMADQTPAVERLLDIYLGIEKRSWKHCVGGTVGRHPERIAFFHGLCASERPMRLGIHIIAVDGVPIAGAIQGAFGESMHALQICFDESYAALGPGQLLLLLSLRQAIDGGYKAFHLLHGSTYYKERWLAETSITHSIQIFRRPSIPYFKARIGETKRAVARLLPRSPEGAYNPEKRHLPAPLREAVEIVDIEPARLAYREIAASGAVVHLDAGALAGILPFSLERERRTSTARPAPPPVRRRVRLPPRAGVSRHDVAIFDADSPPALAFTRSLGRAGVPVQIYAPHKLSVASASRFAATYRACPDPADAAAFFPWLENEVRAGNITVVAPTSDQIIYYLAELRDLLPVSVRAVLPERDTVLMLLFKDRFQRACVSIGQPVPRSSYPSSLAEAMIEAEQMSYPLIIKPKTHVGVGPLRGIVVRDASALRAAFRPFPVTHRNGPIFERYPELCWPMLQEYVPAALANLFSVSGILGVHGEVLVQAGTHKTSQWPPTLGVGTLFEGCEEERLLRTGGTVASKLAHRGLFELELIYDGRIGGYLAIDLNPRAYGQIALDIARGHDLPLLWYRLALGETLEQQAVTTNHARWMHSIPFHIGSVVGLLRGPERRLLLDTYLGAFDQGYKRVDVVNDLADPWPSFVFTAKILRHPVGLIRPFLRVDQ